MIISGGLSDEGVHRDWWLLSLVEHVWTEITVIILNQYGVLDCVDSGRAVVSRFPVSMHYTCVTSSPMSPAREDDVKPANLAVDVGDNVTHAQYVLGDLNCYITTYLST